MINISTFLRTVFKEKNNFPEDTSSKNFPFLETINRVYYNIKELIVTITVGFYTFCAQLLEKTLFRIHQQNMWVTEKFSAL